MDTLYWFYLVPVLARIVDVEPLEEERVDYNVM